MKCASGICKWLLHFRTSICAMAPSQRGGLDMVRQLRPPRLSPVQKTESRCWDSSWCITRCELGWALQQDLCEDKKHLTHLLESLSRHILWQRGTNGYNLFRCSIPFSSLPIHRYPKAILPLLPILPTRQKPVSFLISLPFCTHPVSCLSILPSQYLSNLCYLSPVPYPSPVTVHSCLY